MLLVIERWQKKFAFFRENGEKQIFILFHLLERSISHTTLVLSLTKKIIYFLTCSQSHVYSSTFDVPLFGISSFCFYILSTTLIVEFYILYPLQWLHLHLHLLTYSYRTGKYLYFCLKFYLFPTTVLKKRKHHLDYPPLLLPQLLPPLLLPLPQLLPSLLLPLPQLLSPLLLPLLAWVEAPAPPWMLQTSFLAVAVDTFDSPVSSHLKFSSSSSPNSASTRFFDFPRSVSAYTCTRSREVREGWAEVGWGGGGTMSMNNTEGTRGGGVEPVSLKNKEVVKWLKQKK